MPFDKKISVVKPCTSLLFTNWDKLEHSRTLFNFTLMQYCIYHKSFSVFPIHSLFRSFDTSMTVFFLFPTELLTKTRKLWKFHNFSPCFFGEFRYYCMAYGRLLWDLSIVFCKGCFIWDGLWTFIPCRGWLVGVRFKGDSGSLGIVLTPPRVLKFIPLFLVDLQ